VNEREPRLVRTSELSRAETEDGLDVRRPLDAIVDDEPLPCADVRSLERAPKAFLAVEQGAGEALLLRHDEREPVTLCLRALLCGELRGHVLVGDRDVGDGAALGAEREERARDGDAVRVGDRDVLELLRVVPDRRRLHRLACECTLDGVRETCARRDLVAKDAVLGGRHRAEHRAVRGVRDDGVALDVEQHVRNRRVSEEPFEERERTVDTPELSREVRGRVLRSLRVSLVSGA